MTGALWLGVYVALSVMPLVIVLLGAEGPGRSFWTEFSVGLGFVGLAMMCLQFVLTARFGWLKSPYGSDVIYAFHRAISIAAIVLIVLHPAILFATRWEAMLRRPFTHPWPFWIGTASVVALVWLVIVSVFRQKLKISYDNWRRAHAGLAIGAVALGVAHVLLVGHYLAHGWQRGLWLVYTLAFVMLILYVRVWKPMREKRTPWRVERVTKQLGNAWSLALRADGHAGMKFSPGQFAWVTLGDSPFSDREHPFSFSGSAAGDGTRIEFTIKEVGDWTSRVKNAKAGDVAYVDGPFGALSADRHADAAGFALFAGGIGITPMISHIRTFLERGDARPLWLFYAGREWDHLPLREEIERLRERMPTLRVAYFLMSLDGSPGAGVEGTREVVEGMISAEAIARIVPGLKKGERIECFICGPQAMMDAVERHLRTVGVAVGDYHAERFHLV